MGEDMTDPNQARDIGHQMTRGAVGFGISLVVIGTGWLLTETGVVPGVNWIWITALAISGLVPVWAAGLNKLTAFMAAFMVLASFASLLRQMGKLSVNHEVPGLVIAAGALLVLVTLLPIPTPKALAPVK